MRPTREEYFVAMAKLVSTRSTCLRRSVGCVLTNARGHVLATGYNGVASGQPHCSGEEKIPVYHDDPRVTYDFATDEFLFRPRSGEIHRTPAFGNGFRVPGSRQCVGFEYKNSHACSGAGLPSGQGLDKCEAIHAEQNALLQCKDVFEIDTCYVTVSPCVTCTKLLLNTACQRIVFLEEYPQKDARLLWEKNGRKWQQFSGQLPVA